MPEQQRTPGREVRLVRISDYDSAEAALEAAERFRAESMWLRLMSNPITGACFRTEALWAFFNMKIAQRAAEVLSDGVCTND